jgi:hypothetical protein
MINICHEPFELEPEYRLVKARFFSRKLLCKMDSKTVFFKEVKKLFDQSILYRMVKYTLLVGG